MAEQKDPELTSSHMCTKITTMCRTTISETDQNLPAKIFHDLIYKEGALMRQVGVTEL